MILLILLAVLWAWCVAIVGSAVGAPRWVEWAAIIVGALILGGIL